MFYFVFSFIYRKSCRPKSCQYALFHCCQHTTQSWPRFEIYRVVPWAYQDIAVLNRGEHFSLSVTLLFQCSILCSLSYIKSCRPKSILLNPKSQVMSSKSCSFRFKHDQYLVSNVAQSWPNLRFIELFLGLINLALLNRGE